MDTQCQFCKKQINVPNWKSKNFIGRPANKRFYCDYNCFNQFRDNGGLKRKKKNIRCEKCGKMFFNRKRGKRINKFCSSRCWGKYLKEKYIKEKNPNWKGGTDRKRNKKEKIRTSAEYRKWKKTVIKRDKKCSQCPNNKNLEAHHIKSFSKFPNLIYNIENGITLCHKCHKTYHKLNGF